MRRASARCSCCRGPRDSRWPRSSRASLGVAFKKDVYSESTPFLRGVYFESARVERRRSSPTLERLGARDAPRFAADGAGSLFLRELVLEVIRGDHTLALREPSHRSARPPRDPGRGGDRRALVRVGVGHVVLAELRGHGRLLADRAARVLSKTAGASQIERPARRDRDRGADRAEPSALARLSASCGARSTRRSSATRDDLREVSRPPDQGAPARRSAARGRRRACSAAIVLASDIEWLQSDMDDPARAPQLESYAPRIVARARVPGRLRGVLALAARPRAQRPGASRAGAARAGLGAAPRSWTCSRRSPRARTGRSRRAARRPGTSRGGERRRWHRLRGLHRRRSSTG